MFKKLLLLVPLALASLALYACEEPASANTAAGTGLGTPTPIVQASAIKPQPRVTALTASTAGFIDDYYVIVEAIVKNDGADGLVLVSADMTQGEDKVTKQIPVSLTKGESQPIRFVFPVKWKGGEWTPSVRAEIP